MKFYKISFRNLLAEEKSWSYTEDPEILQNKRIKVNKENKNRLEY